MNGPPRVTALKEGGPGSYQVRRGDGNGGFKAGESLAYR